MKTIDSTVEAQWAKEAEDRLAAYRRGDIRAIPLAEALAKYTLKPASGRVRRKLNYWSTKLLNS